MLNILNFCLSSEVYAAREKNGIYIPKDRYLQEEAEKKVHSWWLDELSCLLAKLKENTFSWWTRISHKYAFFVQAMTEKIERLELDLDTKDKVPFLS